MSRPFSVEACDFSGWATRNDLKCSDGRVIRRDAFKNNDGIKVPLVWNHQHNSPRDVLGHAWLENREEGVYTYGFLNDTADGEIAKVLTHSGILTSIHSTAACATVSPRIQRSPTQYTYVHCLSFGVRFSPVKFSAQRRSTSELLRTL